MDGHTPVALKYLAERGIKLETVTAHRVELCQRPLTSVWHTWLGFEYWRNQPLESLVEEAILFPCPDPDGMIRSRIVRPFPQLDEDTKFLTPKGGEGYPFVPPATWAAKDKAQRPIFVTEGPSKALAILQAGGLPIGVGGSGWQLSGPRMARKLQRFIRS